LGNLAGNANEEEDSTKVQIEKRGTDKGRFIKSTKEGAR